MEEDNGITSPGGVRQADATPAELLVAADSGIGVGRAVGAECDSGEVDAASENRAGRTGTERRAGAAARSGGAPSGLGAWNTGMAGAEVCCIGDG